MRLQGFSFLLSRRSRIRPGWLPSTFTAMSQKKLLLSLLLLLALGGLCLYLNRDSFADRPIQISHRISPWLQSSRARRADPLNNYSPVVFSFNRYYRFSEIKVVLVEEIATNKYAHPLWHLVSETNSFPTASFAYGERLRGMSPKVKGSTADALEPGVKYRLMVRTVGKEAEHDFSTAANK
jgi:hypothetical protein